MSRLRLREVRLSGFKTFADKTTIELEPGVTVVVVEQNAQLALSIADRGYVMQTGRIVLTDDSQSLAQNETVRKAYLGEG